MNSEPFVPNYSPEPEDERVALISSLPSSQSAWSVRGIVTEHLSLGLQIVVQAGAICTATVP